MTDAGLDARKPDCGRFIDGRMTSYDLNSVATNDQRTPLAVVTVKFRVGGQPKKSVLVKLSAPLSASGIMLTHEGALLSRDILPPGAIGEAPPRASRS